MKSLILALAFAVLCHVAAGDTVQEFTNASRASVQFTTDVQKRMEDLEKSKNYLETCPDMSKNPQKKYTWVKVAEYDGEGGRPIFIVIANKVYNVTEFVNYHPAGPEPIKKHAGQDATAAVRVMKADVFEPFLYRFKVGDIDESQKDNSTNSEYIKKNVVEARF